MLSFIVIYLYCITASSILTRLNGALSSHELEAVAGQPDLVRLGAVFYPLIHTKIKGKDWRND